MTKIVSIPKQLAIIVANAIRYARTVKLASMASAYLLAKQTKKNATILVSIPRQIAPIVGLATKRGGHPLVKAVKSAPMVNVKPRVLKLKLTATVLAPT